MSLNIQIQSSWFIHGLLLYLAMRWKHYFYFSQGEKLAIIILLILIVITGAIYIYTESRLIDGTQKSNINQQEFDHFVSQLKDKEIEKERSNTHKRSDRYSSQKPYPYQPKLKEGETIELNSADTSALKRIPGIGSGYSNRIVKYRNLLGGYISISQLKEVWGMDDYLFAKITPYIELTEKHRRIRLNHVDFKQLNSHPYITYKQAQVIMDIRERKGEIDSIERLSLLEEFDEKDIARLKPYIVFD